MPATVTTQKLNGADSEKKEEGSEEDELFQDAVELVMATQQASSSMLQRKFRIGYTRAARLVDAMEEKGIGRPSTYAPTISTILSRNYVVKEGATCARRISHRRD